eukprot:TRINITY_DN14481_c0_g1_i2.p1 TRINITY_DN14481_c0_g1~~TRINITY_DN14481_c0_g1_i2.p1  ORF type:complete len:252 (+),score=46.77 TRINITY_DN14481_c0_g1_i2:48-758(+)
MADSEAFSRLVRAVTSTGYLACVGPSSPQFGWAVSRVEAGDGFQLRCIVHWLVHAMDARFFAWVFSADGAGCSRRHFQLRTGTAEYLRADTALLAGRLLLPAGVMADLWDRGTEVERKLHFVSAIVEAAARQAGRLPAADGPTRRKFELNVRSLSFKWRQAQGRGQTDLLAAESWRLSAHVPASPPRKASGGGECENAGNWQQYRRRLAPAIRTADLRPPVVAADKLWCAIAANPH